MGIFKDKFPIATGVGREMTKFSAWAWLCSRHPHRNVHQICVRSPCQSKRLLYAVLLPWPPKYRWCI